MRRVVIIFLLCLAGILVWRTAAPAPPLRDGDLIFQTSRSGQAVAIGMATGSAFTHMGIVVKHGNAWRVIEAAGPVRETPLKAWIAHGRFGRYAVYRRPGLTQAQTAGVLRSAAALEGRPYDPFFSFDNRAIYCSELAWLAYRAAGVPVGKVQAIGSLNVAGPFARELMAERGARDSACKGLSAEQCRAKLLRQTLITPVAIAHDPVLRQIYSNYPI